MQPQRIRDREGAHKTREGETDFNRNWLDMDVFGDFLENEMLDLMNTHRGVPGGKGIELLCAGKRGKGSCKEHHELKKQYRAVKKAFVEKYLRSDMPGGKASSDGAGGGGVGGGGGGGLDSGRAGGGRGLAAPRAGGGDSGSGGDAAEERRR